MIDSPLMTLKEVAAYLQVHPMTIYRLANNGKLPMFRIGSAWRARKVDIENLQEKLK